MYFNLSESRLARLLPQGPERIACLVVFGESIKEISLSGNYCHVHIEVRSFTRVPVVSNYDVTETQF